MKTFVPIKKPIKEKEQASLAPDNLRMGSYFSQHSTDCLGSKAQPFFRTRKHLLTALSPTIKKTSGAGLRRLGF